MPPVPNRTACRTSDRVPPRVRAAAVLRSVNERYPGIAYLGFACWLAWSKMTWPVVSKYVALWSPADAGMTYGMRTYLVTNAALAAVILAVALLERRLGSLPERLPFLALGAGLASAGSIAMLATLRAGLPLAAFDLCCVVAGLGMGLLMVRAMLLFGNLAPWRILLYEAAACCVGAVSNALLGDLPAGPVTPIFCLLPLASAALFALPNVPSAAGAPFPNRQPDVRLPGSFWQFAFTVLLIAFIAESVVYFNTFDTAARHASTRYTDLITIAICVALIAYAVAFPTSYNYGALYYPAVFVIMVLLGSLFVASEGAVWSLVASLSAYQFFGLLVWCLLGCIAHLSRVSPIRVFAVGYACQTVGSIAGYLAGHRLNALLPAWDVDLLACYVILAMIVLAVCLAVYPPRAMRDLLSAIPADDVDELPRAAADALAWDRAFDRVARAGDLTAREREVAELLARGRGGSYISEQLGVAPATVYSHTRNIYRKLDVHTREELMGRVDAEKGA